MTLTAFRISNFKAFAATQRVPLKPITLIYGANSAGKSSVIHALALAHHAIETGNLDAQRTQIGGDPSISGGSASMYMGERKMYMSERKVAKSSWVLSLILDASPGACHNFCAQRVRSWWSWQSGRESRASPTRGWDTSEAL